jgi:hypothetical protein
LEEITDLFGKQLNKTIDEYRYNVQEMSELEMKIWIIYFPYHLLARVIANEYKTKAHIKLLYLKLLGDEKKTYSEILRKIVKENIEDDMEGINITAQKLLQTIRERKIHKKKIKKR